MKVVKDLKELLPKVNELAMELISECKKQEIIIRVLKHIEVKKGKMSYMQKVEQQLVK